MQTSTFTIPAANLAPLTVKIDRLNRRAVKLGVPGIEMAVSAPRLVAVEGEDGQFSTVHDVTLGGQVPHVAGYTFVAVLEHVDGDVILRATPALVGQLPVHFRNADPGNCDHCHTKRLRTETFVLRSDDGGFHQVGRNCLRDFLGVDVDALVSAHELLLSACEAGEAGGGGAACDAVDLTTYLSHVACSIRLDGWLSSSKARETGRDGQQTAMVARCSLFARGTARAALERAGRLPTGQDREVAEAAIEWARLTYGTKDVEARDDFEHNMAVVTGRDTVSVKATGIAAYTVQGFLRHQERELARRLELDSLKDSKAIATVGERVTIKAAVFKVVAIESQFGTTHIHKMRTSDGNLVVWFASTRPTDDTGAPIEPSETVHTVTGTVKKHETRDGVVQTVLTRCVFWTEEAVRQAEEKAAKKAARAAKKATKDLQGVQAGA